MRVFKLTKVYCSFQCYIKASYHSPSYLFIFFKRKDKKFSWLLHLNSRTIFFRINFIMVSIVHCHPYIVMRDHHGNFIQTNDFYSPQAPIVGYTPLPVILCLFHRLLTIFNELWMAEVQENPVVIPPRLFYDGSVKYFDTHRLGGLESHLMKTLNKEVARALNQNNSETSKVRNKYFV